MTDHEAFLAAIRENPEDDAPRLIYADFLEERGEAERAEFIRVQCEWARESEDTPRRWLEEREQRLLENHNARWLEPLRFVLDKRPPFLARLRRLLFRPQWSMQDLRWDLKYFVRFERGFVESLTLSAAEFLSCAEDLFRTAPILIKLHLSIDTLGDAAALFDSPHLGRLSSLSICDEILGRPTVERLVSCAYLGRSALSGKTL